MTPKKHLSDRKGFGGKLKAAEFMLHCRTKTKAKIQALELYNFACLLFESLAFQTCTRHVSHSPDLMQFAFKLTNLQMHLFT